MPTHYKKPLGYNWQNRPFTPGQLIKGLISHSVTVLDKNQVPYLVTPTGFGVLTGYPLKNGAYYLMALDQDGNSAGTKLSELSENTPLRPTLAFTSGRPGRKQYLYLVPAAASSGLQTRRLRTGKDEALELCWKGHQSVLPPSLHPTAGYYHWCESVSISTPVALAPDWLLALMRSPHILTPKLDNPRKKLGKGKRNSSPRSKPKRRSRQKSNFRCNYSARFWDS